MENRQNIKKMTIKQHKKKYCLEQMDKIQENIFGMELRIATVQEIREGIRTEFGKVSDAIKAHEDALTKIVPELGLTEDRIKKLQETRYLMKDDALSGLSKKGKEEANANASMETRRMRLKWLEDNTQYETEKEPREKRANLIKKVVELIEMKEGLESDANNMQYQMMGKWIEEEQGYFGGIDQEIKEIEKNIVGAQSFQDLIKREVAKL